MTELHILIPGPEIDSDPDAVALWNETGNFIGTALARMECGRAFSIILGRLILSAPGGRIVASLCVFLPLAKGIDGASCGGPQQAFDHLTRAHRLTVLTWLVVSTWVADSAGEQ